MPPKTIRNLGLNKQDWEDKVLDKGYGFIPATKNLNDLEILVLGINPDPKNTYKEEVIKYYWTEWFEEMGVERYRIKNASLPSNMDKIIKDFILNN